MPKKTRRTRAVRRDTRHRDVSWELPLLRDGARAGLQTAEVQVAVLMDLRDDGKEQIRLLKEISRKIDRKNRA